MTRLLHIFIANGSANANEHPHHETAPVVASKGDIVVHCRRSQQHHQHIALSCQTPNGEQPIDCETLVELIFQSDANIVW